MAPTLQSLPPELLEIIATKCIGFDEGLSRSLLQLRSTCREIQLATRRLFVKRFFELRNIRLDTKKLVELDRIHDIPDLAQAIRRLFVECIDDFYLRGSENDNNLSDGPMCGLLERLLVRAFRRMKNPVALTFVALDEDICSRKDPYDGSSYTDVSTTFGAVIMATQAASLSVKSIDMWPNFDVDLDAFPSLGLRNFQAMPLFSDCFSGIKELQLFLLLERWPTVGTLDKKQMGKQLATALNYCENLEKLELHFMEGPPYPGIFRNLAAKVLMPRLQSLEFHLLTCSLHDLSRSLARHAGTLRSCLLSTIELESEVRSQVFKRFPTLLQDLCNMPALTKLHVDHVMVGRFELSFRSRPHISCSFEPLEEDYIEGSKDFETLVLEDDDLKVGLAEVIHGMMWVPKQ